MNVAKDPFELDVANEEPSEPFAELSRRAATLETGSLVAGLPTAVTARLHGFDVNDQPLVVGVPGLPGEIVPARTTVPLLRRDVGSTLVVLFECGDARLPIVTGVMQDRQSAGDAATAGPTLSVSADDDQFVVSAEREIVLRCGDASITLTRAGKIILKGSYIVSRSTGYNRIKGAAVDIN